MDVGRTLRMLRTQAGLTQQDIADKLDVSRVAVGQWEANKSMPRKSSLLQLADLFGTTVADLMGEQAEQIPVRGEGRMVPLLGYTHMGGAVDEDACERMVEVPTSVADAHPSGYCVHADGGCMDNRYPDDCVLMVDPDMEPFNGCAVLAETDGYRSVVREYFRGSSTLVLSPDSHTGEYEDIVVRADDEPVTLKGVVVWYQAEADVRG